MLREIALYALSTPNVLRMKATLPTAELYDALMRGADEAGLSAQRQALARGLSGEVLEIGAGTGLMFPHYAEGLAVTAVEPDDAFRALARPRAEAARARVELMSGSVEALPFDAGRFDAIVVSLVLCSVPSVPTALRELQRVLRPGGEVRLIEHVRSERAIAAALMNALDPLWLRLNAQGCHMNRPTEALLREGGFSLREVRPFRVFTPGLPPFPMRWMRAAPAAARP